MELDPEPVKNGPALEHYRTVLDNGQESRPGLFRCPYFKDLLLAAGSLATELRVRLATPGVDVPMFTSLLRYLLVLTQ